MATEWRSTALHWKSLAQHCKAMAEQSNAHLCRGTAELSSALARQRKAQHCNAVELLCIAWNCGGTAQQCGGNAEHGTDPHSMGLSVQSAGMLRRGIAALVVAVALHSNAWYGKGKAKCSVAKRRQSMAPPGNARAQDSIAMALHCCVRQSCARQRTPQHPTKSNHHNQFKEKGEQHENHQNQDHLHRADPRHLPD